MLTQFQSINLTVLPSAVKTSSTKVTPGEGGEEFEYSSREVKPAILLLGDVLRAHSTFLLHHASSMSALFVRTKRSKFTGILGRYWDTFLSTWTVLMHGNPARNLYGGIKIAACGELGIGVGEEDRGSGEREVLEGLIGRIDGLVDVIVSKFGDGDSVTNEESRKKGPAQVSPWLGSGTEPASGDGAIFLGAGALSRKSMRDVSHWIEDLYRWGPYAYGVVDNPTSNRRTKRWKQANPAKKSEPSHSTSIQSQGVPPPIFKPTLNIPPPHPGKGDQKGTISQVLSEDGDGRNEGTESSPRRPSLRRGSASFASTGSESHKPTNKFVQYMKLGYGTHWSLGGSQPAQGHKATSKSPVGRDSPTRTANDNFPRHGSTSEVSSRGKDWEGQYLIGLMGSIDEVSQLDTEDSPGSRDESGGNDRVVLRTLTLELEREEDARAEVDISIDLGNNGGPSKSNTHPGSDRTGTSNASFESQDRNKTKKLRVVVYIKRPFIFVMLFEVRAEVLALASFYRSLHHQISPLIKPLLVSTNFGTLKPDMPSADDTTPIYDLIWDPKLLTVTTNIPNIPDPHQSHPASALSSPWSRMEALNTHMQIINTYIAATIEPSELERTCKTSRGWWVVWTKITDPEPPSVPLTSGGVRVPGFIVECSTDDMGCTQRSSGTSRGASTVRTSTVRTSLYSGPAHPFLETAKNGGIIPKDKEIFLIRRASDHIPTKTAGRFVVGASTGSSESWATGPGKLVQGIGVDTKWYIETLLNLSR